jgi:hypothetical protein
MHGSPGRIPCSPANSGYEARPKPSRPSLPDAEIVADSEYRAIPFYRTGWFFVALAILGFAVCVPIRPPRGRRA